jgi:MFS family permease
MGCIYYHVVPLLVEAGYSSTSAGLALGISWLVTAFGSLAFSVVADRLGVKLALTGGLCCCALGTLFLLGAGTGTVGVVCVVAFVVLWGAPATSVYQSVPVIFGDFFGSRHLGTLIGVQSAIAGVAGAAAPIATGVLFDKLNAYRVPIYLSAAAMLLATVLTLWLKTETPISVAVRH